MMIYTSSSYSEDDECDREDGEEDDGHHMDEENKTGEG